MAGQRTGDHTLPGPAAVKSAHGEHLRVLHDHSSEGRRRRVVPRRLRSHQLPNVQQSLPSRRPGSRVADELVRSISIARTKALRARRHDHCTDESGFRRDTPHGDAIPGTQPRTSLPGGAGPGAVRHERGAADDHDGACRPQPACAAPPHAALPPGQRRQVDLVPHRRLGRQRLVRRTSVGWLLLARRQRQFGQKSGARRCVNVTALDDRRYACRAI